MSETLEIEYKSMLTEAKYHELIQHFQRQETDFFSQTNGYYDTLDYILRSNHWALRIRLLEDKAEATLKTPQKSGKLETTALLTPDEGRNLIAAKVFPQLSAIDEKLSRLSISSSDLSLFGQLTTRRTEFPWQGQLVVLDESWYNGAHDFELEMEVTEAESGHQLFLAFLAEHNIPYHKSSAKIKRFMDTLTNDRNTSG